MPFSKRLKIKNTLPDFSSSLINNNNNVVDNQAKVCCVLAPYRNGLVLQGYDVVEYHNLSSNDKGVKGSSEYAYILNNHGAEYTFYFIILFTIFFFYKIIWIFNMFRY